VRLQSPDGRRFVCDLAEGRSRLLLGRSRVRDRREYRSGGLARASFSEWAETQEQGSRRRK
jgi:hypothetical protein